jgi:hypothetical protein
MSNSKTSSFYVAIAILCVALGFWWKQEFDRKAQSAGLSVQNRVIRSGGLIAVGQQLSFRGIEWARAQKTVVLAIRAGCGHCEASMKFYRTLATTSRNNSIPILAVSPDDVKETRRILSAADVEVAGIVHAPLWVFGVSATPTLAVVDAGGVIVQLFVGELTARQESHLLSSLASYSSETGPNARRKSGSR